MPQKSLRCSRLSGRTFRGATARPRQTACRANTPPRARLSRARHAPQRRSKLPDPLVMEAVDAEPLLLKQRRQGRIRLDDDIVRHGLLGRSMQMHKRLFHLRGNILIQRSAERNVQELQPPADSQQRHIPLRRDSDSEVLQPVARRAGVNIVRPFTFTVQRGKKINFTPELVSILL